ncbi:MAG TPA: hypothetical protein VNX69_12965 [Steroidobacteraceae bacterium]|nr:hypothetical protein [Steroidobacteraceae bacterium]
MKWSKGLTGSMSMAALLLPLMVAADSHIQTKAASAALAATSHVDFKIVIPTVLYMHVESANDRSTRGAETVAIMSNSRNVSLDATVRTPESEVHARGGAILSASARKIIAQDALCTVGDAAAPMVARSRAKAGDRRMICTVSMP